jgi:lysozyme
MARVKGMDVSHWQGDIVWSRVPEEYRFVYMKSSEGKNFIDKKFIQNFDDSVGRDRAPYHFWRMDGDPQGQAKFWRDQVGDRVGEWGPVPDLEDPNASKGSRCRAELETFLEQVVIEFGDFVTYSAAWWWDSWVQAPLEIAKNRGLIVANYKTVYPWSQPYMPRTGGWNDWLMWQHTSKGVVNGITENTVDLNVFNGGEAQYAEFMKVVPSNKVKLIVPHGMDVEVIYE